MEKVTTVGSDLAKDVVFAARSGCDGKDRFAPDGASRPTRGGGGEAAGVCDWHGGVLGRARMGATLQPLRTC